VHFLTIKDQLMRENTAVLEKLEPEIKAIVLLIKEFHRKEVIFAEQQSMYPLSSVGLSV